MANFTRGIKASEQRSEENRKSGYYRVRTLAMKDGEGPWYIRVLTPLDKMITADIHMFTETKPQPAEYKGTNWQKAMPAVCQNDRMFRVHDEHDRPTDVFEDGYGNCYIHNRDRGKPKDGNFKGDKSTPDTQTIAVAVVRVPVPDPVTGRPVSYVDAEEDFKLPDGTVRRVPRLVLASQKHYNFWSGAEAALFEAEGIEYQDLRIARKGNDYKFALCKPDPSLQPGTPAWERYGNALELVGFNLEEHILEQASPDWYKRWFIEGAVPEGGYGRSEDTQDDEAADGGEAQGTTVDEAEVADFRDQLRAGRQ